MKSRNEEKKRRILARLTARELSLEDLGYVRGSTDNDDPWGGGGPGGSTTLTTTLPVSTEDT